MFLNYCGEMTEYNKRQILVYRVSRINRDLCFFLEFNFNVNCSLAIDGILMEIWCSEFYSRECVHIATTICSAQTFFDICYFLLNRN